MPSQCTCNCPPAVDLTCFLNGLEHNGDNDVPGFGANYKRREQEQFLRNLRNTGWSMIRIDTAKLHIDRPCYNNLINYEDWRDTLIELFKNNNTTSQSNVAVFRTTESGDTNIVEEKQSWELKRCQCSNCTTPDDVQNSFVDDTLRHWINAFHQIAIAVRKATNAPKNVLLSEDTCNVGNKHVCSLDLLRAFNYQAVCHNGSNNDEVRLGSSPHTDWGSLTIVWQDHVGGLQTYCHSCESWVDVLPSVNTDVDAACSTLQLIVHVGDSLSMAIGQQLHFSDNELDAVSNMDDRIVAWSSPRHRVLSPTHSCRFSLVYFVYPPPHESIKSISDAIIEWDEVDFLRKNQCYIPSPLSRYYLLKDQSYKKNSNDSLLLWQDKQIAVFEKALEQVICDKWLQVQREALVVDTLKTSSNK